MRVLRELVAFSLKCAFFLIAMKLNLITVCRHAAAASSYENKTMDHLALLAFKAKITHDPQGALSFWNDSVHFCNWEGVTCGRRHRRVTVLDLQSKGLVGSLAPQIGNMSFSREIWLQNNTFQGQIPPELGRLSRLQVLHLENNSFQGDITSNLSYCSNLNTLVLSYNKLVGKIPFQFSSLSKLILLDLADNYLSGTIPSSLGNLTSLEALSARENFLVGTIPDTLGQLKYLSKFQVATNKLSGIIPPAIYNISSITTFSVSENQLHGSLPSDIGVLLPRLQLLRIWSNNFSGSIPVSLSNATKLQYIVLALNNFTGKVDVDFRGLPQLIYLALAENNLGTTEGDDLNFVTSLLNCSYLRFLDFSDNRLKGILPNLMANLSSSLQWLSIGQNQIYGSFPQWFFTLTSITTLSIQFNQITGNIPMEIGKLHKVERLFLDYNRLSGPVPSSIGNLSSLILLQLDDNNFHSAIPSSLGNCSNLLFVDLSRSNFVGSIPKQLFAIPTMLVSINLSLNNFEGTLPSEIGNLFNLNELYVSGNNLVGQIPNELGGCGSLETLYMDGNNFQGTLPSSFASLKGLRNLDLSRNNLSGEIPRYLEKFALEYVNLSFNNFEGEVPIKGAFANASAVFLKGNNKLCGGIPELDLPRCMNQVSNGRSKVDVVKIVAITMSSVFCVAILSVFFYCKFKKKNREKPLNDMLVIEAFQNLSYERILKATNGFSLDNLLGTGSFGSVYKGTLEENGALIAVKVLNLQQQGAAKSFMAECKVLQNVRHRNLVRIVTACSSIDFQGNDFKALVYEYMVNGNLEMWLYPSSEMSAEPIQPRSLSLLQRMNIAIDVGNALDYLHHGCEKPIVHCDLKPSNILLDNDMVAHIGDFGLAKFRPQLTNSAQSSSIGVRGTIGYTAPEYGIGSEPSTSGDVYSYGILILEMMTAKKPTDDIFVQGLNLHSFARTLLSDDKVLEIVDPKFLQEDESRITNNQGPMKARNDCRIEYLIGMINVGVACSMDSPEDRMDISNAVNELNSIRNNYMRAITGASKRTRP